MSHPPVPVYHLVLNADGRIWAVGRADSEIAHRFATVPCWNIEQQHVGPIYDALEQMKRDTAADYAAYSIFRRSGASTAHSFTVYCNLAGIAFGAGEEQALVSHPDTQGLGDIVVEDVASVFTLAVEKLELCALDDPGEYGEAYMETLMHDVIVAGMALEACLGCDAGRREAFEQIDRVLNGTGWQRVGHRISPAEANDSAAA